MNGYSTKTKSTTTSTPTMDNVNRNSNGTTPLKRTRAKRSCDFCRKRKARCDADHTIPCSNCKAWGFNCEFLTVRKKRGPPSVYVENLETRCKKMESLLTSLTNSSIKDIERNDFRAETYLNPSMKNNINQHNNQYRAIKHNDDNDDNNYDDDIDDDDSSLEEDDSSEYSSQLNSNAMCEDDLSVANMDEALANLNLDDYDSIKYTGHSAGLQLLDEKLFKSKTYVSWPGREDVALQLMSQNELLVVRTDRASSGKKTDTRLDVGFSLTSTIFDDKKLSNSWHLAPGSLSVKTISKDLPTNALIEKAIKLYFSHIHTFLPIVNRTRFETHDMKSSNVLVQAVLAVSFRFASRHFPKLFNKKVSLYADTYFRKVMLNLQDSYRARLRHVQAALLMTLYLDMDETDVESMQWYTLGKAIRMAQDIGLHRSCSNWNLPRSEIETRHRVFYACYILDRLMGARAGKPLTILDRDFDTDLPVPYEVYDDTEEQGPSIYHSFISLIKLCEILGRILKALYAPKSKHSNSNAGLDDPTILAVFDRRLKNWKATLDQSPDGVKVSQAQKVNLLLFYYTVMLLLHRPFIEFSSHNDSINHANVIHGSVDLDALAADSRQACENAASNISVIVRQKQSLMSDPDSYSPLCLPTCFVYSMFQSSLIHLAIVIKNRDSLRRLRLLQRSIALLKQHQMLSSGQRAHNILIMLVAINGINIDNLLENDNTKEEDILPILSEDGLPHSPNSPLPKNRKELQFTNRPSIPPHHNQQQQIPSREQQIQSINNNTMIPSCEDNMPKSSWYQRMMNTSIVGGITPDLHQGITENNSSSQTLEQLLPYGHNMAGSHHHGHNRSDSNATLYHQPDTEMHQQTTYCNNPNYYDLNQPTVPTTNALTLTAKRMDMYSDRQNEPSLFEEAGGNMRILQADSNNHSSYNHANNAPTLLSHQHGTNPPFTQRNGLTSAPLHQTPLPFAASYGSNPTHSLQPNGSPVTNTNNYSMNYLPPSNLNWGDWGVYIGQQGPPIPPTTSDTSPEHQHLHITR